MWFTKLMLIVLITVESFVTSQDEYYSVAEKREGKKYCGRNLANALQLICGGIYNSMFNKKSDPEIDMDWVRETDVLDPNDETDYIFRPRSHAQALMPQGGFIRHTRGAYSECCLKSCSVKEMRGYCSDRP